MKSRLSGLTRLDPRLRAIASFAVATLLLAACAGTVELPKGTGLGDLVNLENKDSIPVKGKEPLKPKDGETLYILNFENIDRVAFHDLTPESRTVLHDFPLVDSAGKEYRPTAFGATADGGGYTTEGMTYDGNMEASGGRFYIRTGSVNVPGRRLTVVYSVPKTASGLALRDGDKRYPVQ